MHNLFLKGAEEILSGATRSGPKFKFYILRPYPSNVFQEFAHYRCTESTAGQYSLLRYPDNGSVSVFQKFAAQGAEIFSSSARPTAIFIWKKFERQDIKP